VQLKTKRELTYLKKLHPKAHWERMKGTIEQSVEYCSKQSSLEGFGEADTQGKKGNRDAMVKAILEGETDEHKLAGTFGGQYLSV